MALAWSAEWEPIWPKDQAAAALIKSSGSLIRASFSGAIPIKLRCYSVMHIIVLNIAMYIIPNMVFLLLHTFGSDDTHGETLIKG